MKHVVYKTVNLINEKYYIGVHSCSCKSCNYLGSGKALLAAVRKYGKENFRVDILQVCATRDDAFELEKTLVNKDDPMSYNLMVGGYGISKPREHHNARSVTINGINYSSQSQAAKTLGLDQKTIWHWVNGTTSKTTKKVSIDGKVYKNTSVAARELGLVRHTVSYRLSSEGFPNYKYLLNSYEFSI